jgi:hypothetical protein
MAAVQVHAAITDAGKLICPRVESHKNETNP